MLQSIPKYGTNCVWHLNFLLIFEIKYQIKYLTNGLLACLYENNTINSRILAYMLYCEFT